MTTYNCRWILLFLAMRPWTHTHHIRCCILVPPFIGLHRIMQVIPSTAAQRASYLRLSSRSSRMLCTIRVCSWVPSHYSFIVSSFCPHVSLISVRRKCKSQVSRGALKICNNQRAAHSCTPTMSHINSKFWSNLKMKWSWNNWKSLNIFVHECSGQFWGCVEKTFGFEKAG